MTNADNNRPCKQWIDRYDWLVGGAMYFVLAYAMIYLTSNGREIAVGRLLDDRRPFIQPS